MSKSHLTRFFVPLHLKPQHPTEDAKQRCCRHRIQDVFDLIVRRYLRQAKQALGIVLTPLTLHLPLMLQKGVALHEEHRKGT